MRRSVYSLFVLAAVILFCGGAHAQNVASITGTVTDSTGAVVPGAAVTLENPSTGVVFKATTNSVGSYSIANVPPGPGYKLTISAAGFELQVFTGLYLNVNSPRTQNAKLAVGSTSQTVQISASSQTVTLNTTDATVGNNFEVQILNDLPVANRDNPAVLFYQQPGVNANGSVTGSRNDQTSSTVDGLDVNDMATGTFGSIVAHAPVDSVQEFRGVTAGMTTNATMGGGGHFDLVTKGGTNAFHGSLVEYHRDTDTQANTWFNDDFGVPNPPLIRNQFGGDVGGPIKREKAFFYFDYDRREDTLSNVVNRTVATTSFKQGSLGYCPASSCPGGTGAKYLTSTQVKNMDPSGLGFDQAILDLFNKRYPTPNNTAVGNGYNTAGFQFNAPFPLRETVYVGRLDYNLRENMKLFGRFTITRQNSTQSAIQFPGDPPTFPFIDRSRAWVVGDTWTIGSNKNNSLIWGQTVADYGFTNTFNPQGITQFSFGGNSSGGDILSQPYPSAVNAQGRVYPIPVIRDDFSWVKGRHDFEIGGTFKYVNPEFFTILNYNEPSIGMGGYLNSGLSASQRPADIASGTSSYDAAFTTALGHYASQSSVYNYDAKGKTFPQGSGLTHNYRYYDSEIYFQDTWKVTPNLTVSYGINWTNYSTPYDKGGLESAPSIDFATYWKDRLAQSAAGISGASALPLISYSPSGKANNAPGLFNPTYKNFGPHLGFDWVPSFDNKSVFSAGIGIDYDRTVISALLYQQAQFSYIFQAQSGAKYGSSAGPTASLTGDARFAGITSPIAAPPAPTITTPYTPYGTNALCAPYGLAPPCGLTYGGAFNESIDKNFKTPYSINLSAGFQHEFPKGFLLKMNYAGRLGRRLMAQADANQLIDFPDKASGQLMSQAVTAVETQIRSVPNPNIFSSPSGANTITPQSWFEDLVPNYYPSYFNSSTAEAVYFFGSLLDIGDFADTVEGLSNFDDYNIGMGSQFSEFTYYTNKGFSSYNGLLTTLHKNVGQGLQFDINYTWSKSIDNVSVNANTVAYGGYGFICDVSRPRECRAPSDFDNRQVITGYVVYDLPFGRGRQFANSISKWQDEAIGGWQLSALPTWRTGFPYFAYSNAFVAGYANDAPAVLIGPIENMKAHPHKDASGNVWMYSNVNAALASYTGLTGFNIGSRNNLYGTHYTDYDLSLGKDFPLNWENSKLRFRCDAFNALNHPTFSNPGSSQRDITQSSGTFGQVTGTDSSARVLQGSLRLEF